MGDNDPRASKVQRRSRGLAGMSAPARDPNDPRNSRQANPLMNERFLGDGLALSDEGRIEFKPTEDTLSDITDVANDTARELAVEALADNTGIARRIDTNATLVSVTDGTKTSLYAASIPAGVLVGTRMARVVILGWFRGTVAAPAITITLTISLGGATIYADVTQTITVSANSRPFEIELNLAALDSGASQKMWGKFYLARSAMPTTGQGSIGNTPYLSNVFAAVNAGTTVDMTTAQTLDIEVTLTGTTKQINKQYAYTEIT